MKTYKNLYPKVCSLKNLHKAYKKARKGKTKKQYVKEFESNLKQNILQLKRELKTQTYKPKPLKVFVIKDPKTRVISASDFRDRVIHHALCNIIEPMFDRIFISDSYASRKNKGTHVALKRFDRFKWKVSGNGKLVKNVKDKNMVVGYVLKADIKHYFNSIDHRILMSIISRKIKDEKILWLIRKILKNHNPKISGKGMPIGNLTSQLFANIYLNQLDYFIKHRFRARFYIRYMDDFIILHNSKKVLEKWKKQINKFLESMKLELHPEKSKIFPIHKGICVVGYRVFYNYKLLKKSNIRLIHWRIKEFRRLHERGNISREKIFESMQSWFAYAKYGNTYSLIKRIKRFLIGI
ncbi:MAG: hypothetical protein ISS36_01765 [Candidatus Aenigmarchaeota archaeon]|nr:hypothetical protein [Candidatus Aenigmarchaeota archaeon]